MLSHTKTRNEITVKIITNKEKAHEEHRYDIFGVWIVDGVILLFRMISRLRIWEVRFLNWLGEPCGG
jgi:hypothetical protein